MGYAKNPKAIKEVEKYLNEMVQASEQVEWRSSDPSTLSYKIRQGIAIAERYASSNNQMAVYAALKQQFKIRVQGNKVIAEPRLATISTIRQSMGAITLPEGLDTMSIIGAALEHQASRMFFPEAQQDDLPQLYKWATQNDYKMVVAEAGITLTKEDVGELAWQPST